MQLQLTERLNKLAFRLAVRRMGRTPPLPVGSVPYTALSMVHHRDVFPYLLALKSLARFAPPQRVVVVADPSIDEADRAVLRSHVPHIVLRDATEFHAPGRVSGGTWERIWAIAEYAQDSFVVQLDADTVTVERPTEVLEAIAQKASFTLGTDDGQRIAPVAVTATWARARAEGPSDHIQQQAESLLDQFDPPGQWQYVRGCSGFAGFAPGSISPQRLHAVSDGMRALLGERWDRWGTEQVTSNLLIASSQNGRVLPHPEYCAPHRRTDATVFMHFIGYVRHKTGLYGQLATRLARELAANPAGRRAA